MISMAILTASGILNVVLLTLWLTDRAIRKIDQQHIDFLDERIHYWHERAQTNLEAAFEYRDHLLAYEKALLENLPPGQAQAAVEKHLPE